MTETHNPAATIPPRINSLSWDDYSDNDLLSPKHLEGLTGVGYKTQERLRKKYGLPFLKFGGKLAYRVRDVRQWIDSCAHRDPAREAA